MIPVSLKFMAHSTLWGYLPIQKPKKSKKLMEEKLYENSLSMYIKFGKAHLKRLRKRLSLIWHFVWYFQI